MNLGTELPIVDEPVEIIDGIVEARKKLLNGFAGRKGIDLEKLERAFEPSLFTMSLSGEATLYPRLGEMFKEIRRRGAVSFLVTNGLNPEVLARFKEGELPTQITISMNAPNERLFSIWHRSSKPEAWESFNKSLDVLSALRGKVRRAVRLTLVKRKGSQSAPPQVPSEEGKIAEELGLEKSGKAHASHGKAHRALRDGDLAKWDGLTNMSEENVGEYVELIKRASPDFVHVKGYKAIGYAKARMGYDKQVWFDSVRRYAIKILEELNNGEVHSSSGDVHASHGKVQSPCDWKGSLRGGLAKDDSGCNYEIAAEDERCCVVMLAKKGKKLRIEKC